MIKAITKGTVDYIRNNIKTYLLVVLISTVVGFLSVGAQSYFEGSVLMMYLYQFIFTIPPVIYFLLLVRKIKQDSKPMSKMMPLCLIQAVFFVFLINTVPIIIKNFLEELLFKVVAKYEFIGFGAPIFYLLMLIMAYLIFLFENTVLCEHMENEGTIIQSIKNVVKIISPQKVKVFFVSMIIQVAFGVIFKLIAVMPNTGIDFVIVKTILTAFTYPTMYVAMICFYKNLVGSRRVATNRRGQVFHLAKYPTKPKNLR